MKHSALSTSHKLLIVTYKGIVTNGHKYKQGTEQRDKVQKKSHLPSTILPSFWKTLSSHHWQWMRYRTFFAESSAGVGPRKTLTTTRTKCSRATASSTSMPLLQRAAALGGETHTNPKLYWIQQENTATDTWTCCTVLELIHFLERGTEDLRDQEEVFFLKCLILCPSW